MAPHRKERAIAEHNPYTILNLTGIIPVVSSLHGGVFHFLKRFQETLSQKLCVDIIFLCMNL